MNKTVDINLAGIFFHIDENAYKRLQYYLDAIKRSFANTPGSDEILIDIETRIAELFSEKLNSEKQVVGIKEVEEIIAIMGQPEDYIVDEEIFDDEPQPTSRKKQKRWFRDIENSYVGGVSSGLGHYLGMDALWVRILWVLLTIFSTGAFILLYIALWILIPEAKTTADKLAMSGEEANINNIQKKISEGFNEVTGKIKDVDYQKYGYRVKSGANSAASGFTKVVLFFINIFVKLIGVVLLLISSSALIYLFIALVVGFFTVNSVGIIAPWNTYLEMAIVFAPLWLISLLLFFTLGIPFFFLFILGLKIMVGHLKSMSRTAKLILIGLWFLSVIGLSIIGIQQITGRAFDGEVTNTQTLPISTKDTLYLRMQGNQAFSSSIYRNGNFKLKTDTQNDKKILFSSNVRLMVNSTKDSVAKLQITKMAQGKDYEEAQERAENIEYKSSFSNNELLLDSYYTSDLKYKYRDQKVQVTLFLPEGSTLFADKNTYSFHRNSGRYQDILKNGDEEKYLSIMEHEAVCINCPEENFSNEDEEDWDEHDDLEINTTTKDGEVQIDLKTNDSTNNTEKASIKINKNGIEIKSQ